MVIYYGIISRLDVGGLKVKDVVEKVVLNRSIEVGGSFYESSLLF